MLPFTVRFRSGLPAYEQVLYAVRKAIAAGQLQPGDHLVEAWVEYMRGLVERLSPPERDKLRADVVGRARAVAEAAGGFLGLGSKISSEEAAVLAALERPFA